MKNKSISVWLILENGKIALQKRREEKFNSVCQATWAGKSEEDETTENAIKRECQEELGQDFAKNFDFSKLEFISTENFEMKNSKWESYNYTAKILEKDLALAKIHKDAEPEFIFIDKNTEIFPLSSEKDPKENIVLFDDQYKIFEKILKCK